jgi:hypothetical protein
MTTLEQSARELAGDLRRLRDAEQAGVPLDAWYAQSLALERRIIGSPEVANLVANFIWDWLADADVRRKAPLLAAEQDAELLRVLQILEKGDWPE